MAESVANLKIQLEQLKSLADSGVLSPSQYAEGEALLKQRVLDVVLAGGSADASAVPTKSGKPSALLLAGLSVGVVVLAAAGYWWKGAPDMVGTKPAVAMSAPGPMGSGTDAPHTTNFDAISAMTDKLAKRLKESPDDVEGWAMLGRSYAVLGRHSDALAAYEKAVALRKNDAALLADYADALAVADGGKIGPRSWQQVERALKLDPNQTKALFLAGTHAFDSKDYKAAIKFWDTAVKNGPADNPFVKQMESALKEARNLAGTSTDAK